jgi:hypothetical protein
LALQLSRNDEDDAIDFDVFNLDTEERLGHLTVRMLTYHGTADVTRTAYLTASTQEGSFRTYATETPEADYFTSAGPTTPTIFTLY